MHQVQTFTGSRPKVRILPLSDCGSASRPDAVSDSFQVLPVPSDGCLQTNPVVMVVYRHNEYAEAASTLFRILGIHCLEVEGPESPRPGAQLDLQPEIYIGGECIGGSLELFESYMSGALVPRLEELGITAKCKWTFDPAAMLLDWLKSEIAKVR